ncbi:MAG: esterase [Candidatus Melainabacteria bacterium HGW-Melainabacteria-1]|nr:MAG: esterase [Candidatus Melainabacteria bacterium HGW-Melainabacteria-1]
MSAKTPKMHPTIAALLNNPGPRYPLAEPWEDAIRPKSLSGRFRMHRQVSSAHLELARDVLIYLPPSYYRSRKRRYPVLYMHDGNNLFDTATSFAGVEWQVDEHAERLVKLKQMREIIIVGVYNTPQREYEYTWDPMLQEDGSHHGGGGPKYARFLAEELKPFVDALYRTEAGREATAVAGSSLGGLISFYLGLHYPHVFSRIGIVSPSLWWHDGQPLKDAARMPDNLMLWVDMGTEEGDPEETLPRTLDFVNTLREVGYEPGENLCFSLAEGAEHNETAWAERVDEMLRYFFGS